MHVCTLEGFLPKKSTLQPNPKLKGKTYKRKGAITPVEEALITQVVLDQPREIKPAQVTALAKALNRPVDAIKPFVEAARTQFLENIGRYVNIHLQAVEGALATEDFETAAKAAAWAITNAASGGARVIDKPNAEGPTGPRVMIGIKVGAVTQPDITVESE